MTRHRKSDPRWRSDAAAEVMAGCVPRLDLGRLVLLAGEAGPELLAALGGVGCETRLWLRRASAAGAATTWPPAELAGRCSAALIRLPRAKDELDMMLHAAATCVASGGLIVVYGANDEGIRSAHNRIAPLLGSSETIDQRAHCRVVAAHRPSAIPALKARLEDWRSVGRMQIGQENRPWVAYPGAFAKGGLDDGTRLLAGTLAALPAPKSALDFGCGTGVLAAHLRSLFREAAVEMADWDAIAARAAGENVLGAAVHVVTRLGDLPGRRFDLIVSNPPIHDGKSEDYTVLGQLIAQAPARLSATGRLVLVVQRRVPVKDWLEAAFEVAEVLAEDTRYCVWQAAKPKRPSARGRLEPRDVRPERPGRGGSQSPRRRG